jgi:hypothetical protein
MATEAVTAFVPSDPERFGRAMELFDAANAQDPNLEQSAGQSIPRELLYAERLTAWILRLSPSASEALRLAGRSQHLCRWQIPRHSYPMTRPGYLQWRATLKKFHAEKSGQILTEVGYPEELVKRVQDLNLKRLFPNDPEACVLEDALCLVFLEFQLTETVNKLSEEQAINALRKSWAKMTPTAQEFARRLPYAPREQKLLEKAIAPS